MEDVKELHKLGGIKARHIPSELTDDGWQGNTDHSEEVTLLEYFYHASREGSYSIAREGILFLRKDWTLGTDRLDSFTVIP